MRLQASWKLAEIHIVFDDEKCANYSHPSRNVLKLELISKGRSYSLPTNLVQNYCSDLNFFYYRFFSNVVYWGREWGLEPTQQKYYVLMKIVVF